MVILLNNDSGGIFTCCLVPTQEALLGTTDRPRPFPNTPPPCSACYRTPTALDEFERDYAAALKNGNPD